MGELVLTIPQAPVYGGYGAFIMYRTFPFATAIVLEGIVEGLDDLPGANPVGWVVSALVDKVKDLLQ